MKTPVNRNLMNYFAEISEILHSFSEKLMARHLVTHMLCFSSVLVKSDVGAFSIFSNFSCQQTIKAGIVANANAHKEGLGLPVKGKLLLITTSVL